MLTIIVPGVELFDEDKNEFIEFEDTRIDLEHSLVSISKWESRWKVPFMGNAEKTTEQRNYYIQAMTLTPDVPPEVYDRLTGENIDTISAYIDDKMSATWFSDDPSAKQSREVITSEVIYYWMISANIPPEFENWHFNRLLSLIRVISNKNVPEKKMSKSDLIARNRALNAKRKAQLNTSG